MKFTQSKDGLLRADLKINFRIGRDTLIDAACKYISREAEVKDNEIIMPNCNKIKTKTGLISQLEYYLKNDGRDSLYYWADDVPKEKTEIIRNYATELVDKLYPQLKPQTS